MNELERNEVLVDAAIQAMSGHAFDARRYLEEHNDGDFRPDEPKPPMVLEIRLMIRMDECADPADFRRDIKEAALELSDRWNCGSAWNNRPDGLNLNAGIVGECTRYEVHAVEPENY